MKEMYKGKVNSPQTIITEDIDASSSNIKVENTNVFPPGPNIAVIGNDISAETIKYSDINGNILTGCTRGFQGEARAWEKNSLISRNFTEYDLSSLQDNILELNKNKIDKVDGKGLSANDFTDAFKTKLESLKNYNDATTSTSGLMSGNDKIRLDDSLLPLNEAVCNLGLPKLEEIALMKQQMDNKLFFFPISKIHFEISDDNGATWSEFPVSDMYKKRFVSDKYNSGITFAKGKQLRVTFDGDTSRYLNYLYTYMSTQGTQIRIKIEKFLNDTWSTHVDFGKSVSGWPTHAVIKHNRLPFGISESTVEYASKIRITYNAAIGGDMTKYPNVNIYGISWYGGYPSGRAELYYYDENKNVIFPANVSINGGKAVVTVEDLPKKLSQLLEDSTHRTVTDAEKAKISNLPDKFLKSEFIENGDFNNLIESGCYVLLNNPRNAPNTATQAWIVVVITVSSNGEGVIQQMATSLDRGLSVFYRAKRLTADWGSWYRLGSDNNFTNYDKSKLGAITFATTGEVDTIVNLLD